MPPVAADTIALFHRAADTMLRSQLRRGCAIRLPDRGRLLATGDLHDNPMHLKRILRLARLDARDDHHVVLHEMIHGEHLINGMDFSHRMLARVAELVVEFPAQVHPILANHELSQLTGRGVSKGAGNSVHLFNDALEYVYVEDWPDVCEAIHVFIEAMPLAVLSERGVCCAHSLPDARKMGSFDSAVLERPLTPRDYERPDGAAYLMTWGRTYSDDQVEQLCDAWGVSLFVLGHQHAEMGVEVKGPRVIVLNSDHERAAALPLDLATIPTADEASLQAIPLAALGE